MKVYVAGAWIEQHQRARPLVARLRAAGLTVPHDWTQAEGDVCACGHHRQEHQPFRSGPRSRQVGCAVVLPTGHDDVQVCPCEGFNGIGGDAQLTVEARRRLSLGNLRGVLAADLVWLLAPDEKGASGCWVELGTALAARQLRPQKTSLPPVCSPYLVVSGSKWQRSVFTEPMTSRAFEKFDGWLGPDAVFGSDDNALTHIIELAAKKDRPARE